MGTWELIGGTMKKDANRRKQGPNGAEKRRAANASHRGNTEGEHGDKTAALWRVLAGGLPVSLRALVNALDEGNNKRTHSGRRTTLHLEKRYREH